LQFGSFGDRLRLRRRGADRSEHRQVAGAVEKAIARELLQLTPTEQLGLKSRAEKIFGQIGVSSSQAVTMFYRQVVMRHGMPFDVCIPNKTTLRAMAEADAGGTRHAGTTAVVFDHILNARPK
jgi:DNA-damage-inducible protein J